MILVYVALALLALSASFVAGALYGRKEAKVTLEAVDSRLDKLRNRIG